MTADPRALIATGLEHEERITPGEWSLGVAGSANVVRFDGDDITGVADVPRVANRTAIAWLRNNARAILTGWAQALDEVERIRKSSIEDVKHMQNVVTKTRAALGKDIGGAWAHGHAWELAEQVVAERDALRTEVARLTADRDHWREARRVAIEGGEVLKAEVVKLRTDLVECRLVIEQQDRDLERARAAAELSRSGAAEAVCDADRLRNENEQMRGGLAMLRDEQLNDRIAADIDAILERKP